MSGSLYFKAPQVRGDMKIKELFELAEGVPKGTRCLADYGIALPVFNGRAVFGWDSSCKTQMTVMINGLPDKTVFILDDKLEEEVHRVLGSLVYLNT